MRRALPRLLPGLLTGCLLFAGCGGDEGPEFLDVTGHWTGAHEGVFLQLTLSEGIDGVINGTGTIQRFEEPTVAVDVEGVHSEPRVSLLLTAPGRFAINYSGQFDDEERILGALSGDGFEQFPLILLREIVPEDN